MAVLMELSRILIREVVDHQIIELREVLPEDADSQDGDPFEEGDDLGADPTQDPARRFPIVIGLPEAQAIERRLKNIEIKRPQTHDLLASVIREMGGTLESISIHDLSDHTFYAALRVRKADGEEIDIDSRPSDAIALGIAQRVPIYVAEHVLDQALQDPM